MFFEAVVTATASGTPVMRKSQTPFGLLAG
jgi:hypothetical protein